MENVAMNEFRRQVGEYINQTYYANKSFVLTKGQKRVAALVPIAILDRLSELESFYSQTLADRQQADASVDKISETDKETV
ncbi:prevent-host-death family protein [Spirosoma oryzae]|uniref:Prevent-host-death family protein n=2 Tax=Spirosoma TaxID=107 RepID=D2QVT3_SPILD|nr:MULTISPECIES: type II toxin-antitoxin system prevent-host-death family antitoxin [Spirosoma]ADB42915.1 prevent-host-death family protein [Spirosoma linguale DSM 74]MCX6213841.1 type II toxin-antitoxin system prevent-host-death family antitoxin [Spirosoma sp.]PRY34945.1 prevent-host-death family protein [Spirosoma oryzae]